MSQEDKAAPIMSFSAWINLQPCCELAPLISSPCPFLAKTQDAMPLMSSLRMQSYRTYTATRWISTRAKQRNALVPA